MTKVNYLATGTAVIAILSATPAIAQEADAEIQLASVADTDSVIVVTANRVEENLQDVSGVVQAFSGDQLRRDGVQEIRQLQTTVPGLNIANQEGNIEIFIRGVGSANNTELGDPGAAPHLNGIYIPRPRGLGLMFYDVERVEVNKGPQGTLYGRNALAGTLNIITARPDLDDISGYAQIEYGNRDSYAAEGAINIPVSDTFALRAAGTYINRDYDYQNTGDPSLDPAGLEENYAGRLSLLWEPTDRLSIFIMGDYGRETGTGYPGTNIINALTNTGRRAETFDQRQVAYRGPQGDLENELWGIQGQISYQFDGFSLQYLGSFRSVDFEQTNAQSIGLDYPGRDRSGDDFDDFSTQYWVTRSESQVHELRLVADQDQRFRWTLGGFFFDENQEVGFLSLADKGFCCFSGTEFTMPDVDGTSYAVYADGTFDVTDRLRIFGGIRYTEEEKARFGIGGNLALVLGGEGFGCCFATRFGTEGFVPALLDRPNFIVPDGMSQQAIAQFLIEATGVPGARDTIIPQIGSIADGTNPNGNCFVRDDIDNGFITCPTDPAFNGGFSFVNLTVPGQQRGSSNFDFLDWRAGFEFDITEDSMIYAKVSTGHKSGGFNDSFDPALIPELFSPEDVIVYEIGTRNTFDLFGRRATANLTGFYYDYNDQVFQDLTVINVDPVTGNANGFSLVNRNVGGSRIYGLEAETSFSFTGNFRLTFNALYLDTEITEGVVADVRSQNFGAGGVTSLIDLSGNDLPLASDFSFTIKLDQHFPAFGGTLDWQALYSHRSSYFLTQFNEDPVAFVDINQNVVNVQSAQEAGFPDRQEAFGTLNLGIGWTSGDDRFRIEAYASNLFDQQASNKALVGSGINVRFLNDAQRYGVRLITRF
ncbi:MAG: TonB-dependent receptor [Pseudomonadota bacterium]